MKNIAKYSYSKMLDGTLKVKGPIKRLISKPTCEVHVYIQNNSIETLKLYGYTEQHNLFNSHIKHINKGVVWADQDFKSYYHFYNPNCKRQASQNALVLAKKYYNKAIMYYKCNQIEKTMFYLGAICHLIQDATVPQHAKATLLDNHLQFEAYIRNNYKFTKEFESRNKPIELKSIDEYINYNALMAIEIDNEFENIKKLNTKFYMIGMNTLKLAQGTTTGFMILFYRYIKNIF